MRWVAIVGTAAAASLILAALAVRGEYAIGPGTVEVSVRPQMVGATVVSVPPFGTVQASTHRAPMALVLAPTSVDTFLAQQLAEQRPTQDELVEALRGDLEAGLKAYAVRLGAGGLLAGLLAAAALRVRSPTEALVALVVAAAAPVGLYAASFSGYEPDAFREPTLTGALSRSPELLGPVQQFGERFNMLRGELDEIGSITFQLYQFLTQQSPIPDDAIRILHISDLHLNPVGFDVAQQVARRFNVVAVIDSGDITAEGTPLESTFVERIQGFTVPFYFVRGNHDSMGTQEAIAAQPNARVLDGNLGEVAGITLFGVGDPLYTPDRSVPQPTNEQQREAKLEFSLEVERMLDELAEPPDVLIVHDKFIADRAPGKLPLILHGHEHRWSAEMIDGTHILGVASTGAAGLRSFAAGSGDAIGLQVLYFDRESKALLGYDRIEVRRTTHQFQLRRIMITPDGPPEDDELSSWPEDEDTPTQVDQDANGNQPAGDEISEEGSDGNQD